MIRPGVLAVRVLGVAMAAAWLMTPLADAQSRPASQPTSAPAKQDPKDMDSTKGTGSTKGNEPVALPTSDRDWFKIVPPDSETTRRAIAKALPIFEKGNASDVQNEITDLCELKDAAVIPYLLPLLNRGSDEESEQNRSAARAQPRDLEYLPRNRRRAPSD